MSVLVLLEANVKPDRLAEFISYLKDVLPDTRSYDGCQSVTINANQDDGTDVVFVEEWQSRTNYEAYLGWRAETGVRDEILEMLAEPPTIRFFDDTGA